MKLALTQFITLDGVCQGPGDPSEDTSGGFTRGGWLVPHIDDVFVRQASDWLDHADGLLFGRRTYDAFARDWPAIMRLVVAPTVLGDGRRLFTDQPEAFGLALRRHQVTSSGLLLLEYENDGAAAFADYAGLAAFA